jgi:CTP:molybdopterin cytidylyltransferase MocA
LKSGLTDTPGVRKATTISANPPLTRVESSVDTAVLLATAPASEGGPAALMPWAGGTVLARLVAQLSDLGVGATLVLTRPGWEADVRRAVASSGGAVDVRPSESTAGDLRVIARAAAAAGGGAVVVMYGDIVTHREALAGLIADPRVSTGALAGSRTRPMAFRIQTRRGRIVGAASPYHAVRHPNATFLGVLRTGPAELEALAGAAERLAGLFEARPESWQDELERKTARWRLALARAGESADERAGADEYAGPEEVEEALDDPPEGAEAPVELSTADEVRLRNRVAAAPEDAVSLLLVGLVRGGTRVGTVYLRRLLWGRPLSAQAAATLAERLRDLDEDRLLLYSAVKHGDGFFTTFFVSPYSKYVARWAARRGLTPNQVTTASLLIGVLAAAAFATGDRWGLVAGAVLLQIAFMTDCVDGQLARYTRTFSTFGAWLDSVFDRAKEYLAFAGLAIGAARAGDPVWLLAVCAITLQTVRHMSDFSYGAMRQEALAATPQPPLEQPLDRAGAAAAARRAAAAGGTPVRAPERPLAVRVLAVWHGLDRSRTLVWLKRMIAFPIGERFAVISITAALFTPRTVFIALLAWGGVAFAYTHAGRVLRAVR